MMHSHSGSVYATQPMDIVLILVVMDDALAQLQKTAD